MNFTNVWTGNWENAFHGLRHPMESYDRSDSQFGIADNDVWIDEIANEVVYSYIENWKDERVDPNKDDIKEWLCNNGAYINSSGKYAGEYAFIGANDLDLAQRMIRAGSPNDKFLRQIFVSVDITAPLFWWKEADTYKIGTTANSTSTMHKLALTPITLDCFEMDDFNNGLVIEDDDDNPTFIVTINDRTGVFIDALEKLRLKYLETRDIRYWKELIRWLPESWLQTRTWTANYAVLRNIIHWRSTHRLTEWHQFIDWCKTLPYSNELLFFDNNKNL